MTNTYFLAILLTTFISGCVHASEIKRINYEGFSVWVDCDNRGAVKFQYNAQHDTGSYNRHKSFYIDPNIPSSSPYLFAETYKQI